MAIAHTNLDPVPFVTKADAKLPPEQQTTFMIRPMTFAENAKIYDIARTDEAVNVGSQMAFVLPRCVVGWRNFLSPDGKKVEFKTDKSGRPTVETMNALTGVAGEIFSQIAQLSRPSEKASGNSGSSPASSPASDVTDAHESPATLAISTASSDGQSALSSAASATECPSPEASQSAAPASADTSSPEASTPGVS